MLDRIDIKNFGIHEDTHIQFDAGVNIFTGETGAGKSLIGDAVFWCLYGESLRDGRKWKPVEGASVSLITIDKTQVFRIWKGAKFKLSLNEIETGRVTEIQDEIDKRFGSAKYNKAVRFFHRSKAAKFSLATDGERRAIVESLIGVEIFDEIQERLKTEKKDLLSKKDGIETEINDMQRKIARLEGSFESLREPAKPDISELMVIDNAIQDGTEELNVLMKLTLVEPIVPDEVEQLSAKIIEARSEYDASTKAEVLACHELKRLKEIGTGRCSKCGNFTGLTEDNIGNSEEYWREMYAIRNRYAIRLQELNEQVDTLRTRYANKMVKYRLARSTNEKQIYEKRGSLRELDFKKKRVSEIVTKYNSELQMYTYYKKEVQDKLKEEIDLLDKVKARGAGLSKRLTRIEHLLMIYGNKGARIIALSNAFETVGKVTTKVLRQIGVGKHRNAKLRVEVSSDLSKIDLVVNAGDYEGSYGGLSVGEGAMFDFALLKALGALSWRAKLGLPYLYDDVLEGLDRPHKRAICEYIEAEAESNQVLLFTYDQEVIEMFDRAKVFYVENGKVL